MSMVSSRTCSETGALAVLVAVAGLFLLPQLGEAQSVDQGRQLWFAKGCDGCHTIGGGTLAGPDLAGLTQRRSMDWIRNFLADTDDFLYEDPIARRMVDQWYGWRMPEIDLREDQINALIAYIEQRSSGAGSTR